LQHAAELQSLHEQRVIAHIGFEGRNQLLKLLERLAELPCIGEVDYKPGGLRPAEE